MAVKQKVTIKLSTVATYEKPILTNILHLHFIEDCLQVVLVSGQNVKSNTLQQIFTLTLYIFFFLF